MPKVKHRRVNRNHLSLSGEVVSILPTEHRYIVIQQHIHTQEHYEKELHTKYIQYQDRRVFPRTAAPILDGLRDHPRLLPSEVRIRTNGAVGRPG